MKTKDLEKKMLKLLTLGDEIACGPKIKNHIDSVCYFSL